MTEVIEAFGHQVNAKWKHFGSLLHLDAAVIETIDRSNRDCADCMLDLVTKWVYKDERTTIDSFHAHSCHISYTVIFIHCLWCIASVPAL